jgi:hypothetical protein
LDSIHNTYYCILDTEYKNMDTTTQNQIAEYYAKLPKNLQDAFSSMTWMTSLQTISEKYKLNDLQKETLATETTLVFLGMIHNDQYENELVDQLEIEADIVDKMIVDINEAIFKPIKMDLEKTYISNIEALATEKYGDDGKLDERFRTLPVDVQEAVGSVDYQNAIVQIGQKEKLTVDQMGALEEATTKVMLGIVHPGEYRGLLMSKLGIEKERVDNIVTAVNTKIFLEIRESFMKMFETEDTKYDKPKVKEVAPTIPTNNAPAIENHTILDRDQLLNQLENPQRVKPAIQTVATEIPKAVLVEEKKVEPVQSIPVQNPTPTPIVPPIPAQTPQPTTPPSFIPKFLADKMGQTVVSEAETVDHSLPKLSTPPNITTTTDPYHEVID